MPQENVKNKNIYKAEPFFMNSSALPLSQQRRIRPLHLYCLLCPLLRLLQLLPSLQISHS